MSAPSEPVRILEELVAFRTDRVDGDEASFANHLEERLRGLGADVHVFETPRAEGKPAASVYARFGRPQLLVNAHLDTVPPNRDWSTDPFVATIAEERLHALGACDTKGAIASILAALAEARPRNTGILFSGDEEFSSVAMTAFLASPERAGIERAIVCEPTNLRIGTRHRGFHAFEARVSGPGGHSSLADTLPAPIARLAKLAVALDAWGERHKPLGPSGFRGMCMNIAKLDGGIAFNVIPAEGCLIASFRPPPGADDARLCAEIRAIAATAVPEAKLTWLRKNPPFATTNLRQFAKLFPDDVDAPLDLGFWTEAALLEAAGVSAVVYGVGDIAQAHAPNEWVPLRELHLAKAQFRRIFEQT